jgi:hypothetical protein
MGDELDHGLHQGLLVSALEAASAPEHVHVSKLARPEARLTLGETTLKWYDLATEGEEVPLLIRALARRNLRDAFRAGELGISGELGFVILHRCSDGFYFLLACTWRNDNELWEAVWAKNGDAHLSFRPWPVDGAQRPTFCVWELGIVAHEGEAFARYLRSDRSASDRETYVRDAFGGVV